MPCTVPKISDLAGAEPNVTAQNMITNMIGAWPERTLRLIFSLTRYEIPNPAAWTNPRTAAIASFMELLV
jgi:hypothetical protein